MSEVEERPRLVTGGYGWHRSQWVNSQMNAMGERIGKPSSRANLVMTPTNERPYRLLGRGRGVFDIAVEPRSTHETVMIITFWYIIFFGVSVVLPIPGTQNIPKNYYHTRFNINLTGELKRAIFS